jgi:hypothetical protein
MHSGKQEAVTVETSREQLTQVVDETQALLGVTERPVEQRADRVSHLDFSP